MRMNKRRLSEWLGISETSLTDWQRNGMPVVTPGGRGRSGEYDPAQVLTWIRQTGFGLAARGKGPYVDLAELEQKMAKPKASLSDVPAADMEIARAILQARAAWLNEMPAWEYPMTDNEAAEFCSQLLYLVQHHLELAGYNAMARVLDVMESEAKWPVDRETIIERARACIP